MENIEMKRIGSMLTLTIDLSDHRYANKRNITVATSQGEVWIPGTEIYFKLYAYKKLPVK